MSPTDAKRFELHKTLREELGAQAADTLMEYLPDSGWSDVARQRDIDGTHEAIRNVRNELHTEISALRTELHLEMAHLKSELIAYIETRFNQQNRWIIAMLMANTMATLSVMATVALKL